MSEEPVDLLRRESGSLVQRLRLWTPARWAARAEPYGMRSDLVRHLAQALADTTAALEGEPLRELPRLDDLGVADQLAVTSDDLVRSGPPDDLARRATAHLLAHRSDLLEEDVPPGLAAALGLGDVVSAGKTICEESGRTPLGRT